MDDAAQIWDRRLLLVTGKGGVGKTTISAALAKAARAAGHRVLLAELTPDVSSRSQLLGFFGEPMPRGDEPVALSRDLWGVRITPSTGHKLFLRAALKVRVVVDTAMKSAALRRFLMAAPAFPEIGVLYQLVSLLRDDRYDHIVVDLPATGHALGLVALPKVVLRVVPSGLIGNAIREGLEIMTDPSRSGAVITTLPEDMPVTEAMELAAGLEKQQIPLCAMILNQMPKNEFSDQERRVLDEHIRRRQSELLLGAREFRRLERALAAQKSFREKVPSGVHGIEVTRFSESDPVRVIDRVWEALTTGVVA